MFPSQTGVYIVNIAKDLAIVASSLRCEELKETNTVRTICYLISKYNYLETEVAYSIILEKIPEAIQAWKEGKAHNLSSAIYRRMSFHLLNAIREEKREMRKAEKNNVSVFSLDSHSDEETNLHETIEGKSETIDWGNAFDYIFGNAGFTEREKQIFLGLKDGKTLEQLGNEFSVSRQAIHLSKKAIELKANRIKHRVLG